jgi:hypothetical protein
VDSELLPYVDNFISVNYIHLELYLIEQDDQYLAKATGFTTGTATVTDIWGMMEADCASEMSVTIYQTTRRHIPHDINLHCLICYSYKTTISKGACAGFVAPFCPPSTRDC